MNILWKTLTDNRYGNFKEIFSNLLITVIYLFIVIVVLVLDARPYEYSRLNYHRAEIRWMYVYMYA